MTSSSKRRWYIKQGEAIQGPFPNQLIGRYLILGRITLDTQVSLDKEHWTAVENYPAMVPDVVKEAGTEAGDRALMLARIREDERSSQSTGVDEYDDRRDAEEDVMQLHRQVRDDVLRRYSVQPKKNYLYIGLFAVALLVAVGLYLAAQDNDDIRLADCNAAASPGINWSGCNKQGEVLRGRNLSHANLRSAKLSSIDFSGSRLTEADMAYADLSQARLQSVQLQQANLKGANLRQADLQQADLSGANLAYAELVGARLQGADLSHAIFDHAIWVNGEQCLPGSVGACLLPLAE
jgi:hypothetical protein